MPSLSLTPAPAAAAAYCRQARRLRAQFGGDATRLQAALRDLASDADRQRGIPPAASVDRLDLPSRVPGPASLFSSRVAAAVTDGVLRYSARQDLLREAGRMGIDRFQANLLIAAVQHREAPPATPSSYTLQASALHLPFGVVLAALSLQASIASAIWWILHS